MAMNSDFADYAEFFPQEAPAVDPLEQYLPVANMGQMPTLGAAMSNSRKGWFMPGVKAGMQDIGGMLAAGVGAVGGAIGSDAIRDWGIAQSDAYQRQARRVGRPDLDYTPWSPEWAQARKGITDIPEWLGYQVAKQLPQVGLAMAGGGAVGAGLKAAGYVAPGAEFAAALPRALGGGGLRAGMAAEEAAAARGAGQELAQQFAGTTLAGMPQAAGSMYQSEVDRARATGDQPRQGAAIGSLFASPIYSALDAVGPSTEVGMLRRGLEGGLAKRVGTAALSEGLQEFVQEGAQTGMEMAFRPDLSTAEKAQNIVDAAITGGLVGGVIGAPGGIRRIAKVDPSAPTTEDLKEATTEADPAEKQGPPEPYGPFFPPGQKYPSPIGPVDPDAPPPPPRNRLRRKAPPTPRSTGYEAPPITEADIPPPGIEDVLGPGEEPGVDFAPYAADDVFERTLSEDDEGAPPPDSREPPPDGRVPSLDERPITSITPTGPTAARLSAGLAPDDPSARITDPSAPVTDEEIAADPALAKMLADREAVRAKRAAGKTPTAEDVAGKLPPADLSGEARLRKLAEGTSQERAAVTRKLKAIGSSLDMGDGIVLTRTGPNSVELLRGGKTVRSFGTGNEAILSFRTPAEAAVTPETSETPPETGAPAAASVPTIDLDEAPRRTGEGSAAPTENVETPAPKTEYRTPPGMTLEKIPYVGSKSGQKGETHVVDDGRFIAIMNVNGVRVPFYVSTGSGGKTNVQADRWYPFWGRSEGGWYNKGQEDDINSFYGSKKLREAAQWLDENFGNSFPGWEDRSDRPAPEWAVGQTSNGNNIAPTNQKYHDFVPVADTDEGVRAFLNRDMKPIENGMTPGAAAAWRTHIQSLVDRIEGGGKPATAPRSTRLRIKPKTTEAPEQLTGEARLRQLADGISQSRASITKKLKDIGSSYDMGDGYVLTRTAADNVDLTRNGERINGFASASEAILSFKTPEEPKPASNPNTMEAAYGDANKIEKQGTPEQKKAVSRAKREGVLRDVLTLVRPNDKASALSAEAISRRVGSDVTPDDVRTIAQALTEFGNKWTYVTEETPEQKAALARAEAAGVTSRLQNLLDKRRFTAADIAQRLDNKLTAEEVEQAAIALPGNTVEATPSVRTPLQRATGPVERLRSEGDLTETLFGRANRLRASSSQQRAMFREPTPEQIKAATDGVQAARKKAKKKLMGLRFDAAGQPLVNVNARDVPVISQWSVPELLDSLIKLTKGDKRLRALSGMLRKYAGDATAYMLPRDALRAATGFDGAYDAESRSIYLPYDPTMTDDQQTHAFLHEAAHAALQSRLDASPAARAQIMLLAGKLAQTEGVDTKAYAFTDAHEFLSEGLSNGDTQDALEAMKISARDAYKMGVGDAKNGFMALVHMAAEWLGLRSQLTGLEAIMRVQEQLTDDTNITPKGLMAFVNGQLKNAGVSSLDKLLTSTDDREIEAGRQALANTAKQLTAGAETQLRGVVLDAEKLMASVSKEAISARLRPDSSFRGWLRAKELYWSSFGHILEKFVKLFKAAGVDGKNPLVAYGEHMAQRAGLTARMAQLWRSANDQWMAALARSPKIAKEMTLTLNKLMALTTEFGIDPKKTFEEQKHLLEATDSAALREVHKEVVSLLKYIEKEEKQGKDKAGNKLPGIFDVLRAVNDTLLYSYQAVQLYNMVRSDPVLRDDPAGVRAPLTLTRTDPVEKFMNDASLHENPIKAAKYWKGAVTERMAETREFLKEAQAMIKAGALSDTDASKLEGSRKPLAKMLDDIGVSMNNLERSPYFHLGRHGKFIVRFDVRRDPTNDKRADPAAVARLIRALETDFPDVGISGATDNYHMMVRFESADERNKFHDIMQRLQDEGVVEKGKLTASQLDTAGADAPMQPDWLQKYITNINSSDAFTEEQKQAMVSTARITWLDMLPDTAVVRVLAKREGVPGYNKDMLRNFAFRAEVGVNALANLSIAAKVREAFTEMKAQRGEASADPARRADADMIQQVIDELATRDADRPRTTGVDWIDEVRAFNHAFFLGASPAYMIVNMTQLGVMLWPELAKNHGFVKAAKTIAKVTPLALKIIKETFNAGRKLGWSRALDSIITADVLEAAMPGDSQKELREFVQRMVNSGNIDLGSPMRELGRKATGVQETRVDRIKDNTLRFASVLGYYSETLTRLIAAMSAHDLAQSRGETSAVKLDGYASSVLNNAMFNYSNWYTARATGKAGVLGRFTPIPASFQQYTLQLLQKLYREAYDAVGTQAADETAKQAADRRSAARTFLIGHTTALAMLAGSMGMPFASVAFTVADRIRETLGDDDDEPVDTKADYRNWLATVFGKDMGAVIAHGLPRLGGFDVSGRTGEHDLIPFSRFLADRREMQDRVKDLVMRSAGSPVSMMSGVAVGAWQMSNGEVLQGMQTLLPSALKSALKAGRLATEGFVDDESKMQLPLDADALDIFWQSMGLNPAKKAEYTEANLVRATRRTLLARKEGKYRNDLIEAMQNDPDAVSEKLDAATRFGIKNPAYNPLPTLGSTMARRAKQEAVSRAMGVPLGYNLRDPRERDAVAFADFGSRGR